MQHPLVAGVAGGVGTTTIARAVHAHDSGIYAGGVLVDVLVARSTVHSLGCAQRAIAAAPEQPILAVVADVPRARPSGNLRARLRMTEPHVAATVMVPFVLGWSDLDDPHLAAAHALLTPGAELARPQRAFAAVMLELVDLLRYRVYARQFSHVPPVPGSTGPPTPGAAHFPAAAGWPNP